MVSLRHKYASALDHRNLTGIQLIDRNDELCILYEKANLQEAVLRQGDESVRRKDAQMKALKREIATLRRKIEIARRKLPSLQARYSRPRVTAGLLHLSHPVFVRPWVFLLRSIPRRTLHNASWLLRLLDRLLIRSLARPPVLCVCVCAAPVPVPQVYAQTASTLQKLETELAAERQITAALCAKLENPSASAAVGGAPRCRQLRGTLDPEPEQLAAKVEVLSERLSDKKEQLLEKDLVLDEMTALSDKLRLQAAETRGSTLDLAKKVNDYQGRIREITRKMMAAISELSMYQATTLKLQQNKDGVEGQLALARTRLAQGLPPTEEAEFDWLRLERDRMRRQEALVERINREKVAVTNAQKAAQGLLVRTTAPLRPNSYFPEELSLPKPYGAKAPFKATTLGATARHIRKPNPPQIQI